MSRTRVIGACAVAVGAIAAVGLAAGSTDVIILALILAGFGLIALLTASSGASATGAGEPEQPSRRYHAMMRHRGQWAVWDAEAQTHMAQRFASERDAEEAVAILNERRLK